MKLYADAKDGVLYNASAEYNGDYVVVKKGSKINLSSTTRFMPQYLETLRHNEALFENQGYLKKDLVFNTLSSAAIFVTGQKVNGKIVWKSADGRTIKEQIEDGENNA